MKSSLILNIFWIMDYSKFGECKGKVVGEAPWIRFPRGRRGEKYTLGCSILYSFRGKRGSQFGLQQGFPIGSLPSKSLINSLVSPQCFKLLKISCQHLKIQK